MADPREHPWLDPMPWITPHLRSVGARLLNKELTVEAFAQTLGDKLHTMAAEIAADVAVERANAHAACAHLEQEIARLWATLAEQRAALACVHACIQTLEMEKLQLVYREAVTVYNDEEPPGGDEAGTSGWYEPPA